MKGVSSLIAVVVIIAIAVSISAAMASWFLALTTSTAEKTNPRDTVECAPTAAAIKIMGVFASGGQNRTVRVMVENSGYSDNLTIKSALVYNISGHSISAANLPAKGLNRGESAVIVFPNVSLALCPYSFDRAVVTTNCAGVFDIFDHQPKCE